MRCVRGGNITKFPSFIFFFFFCGLQAAATNIEHAIKAFQKKKKKKKIEMKSSAKI